MSDLIKKTLEYDFEDGTHEVFNKYWEDIFGVITNKDSGNAPSYFKSGKYNRVTVYDDTSRQRKILVGRSVASTFLGPPPTLAHTADHIDNKRPDYDALENIRWLCKTGQVKNRNVPETYKNSLIIIKDDIEKTANEWVESFTGKTNHMNRGYTETMIRHYARKKHHGYSFKEYPDLDGEIWLPIKGSDRKTSRWEISNMIRVKRITHVSTNVMWGDRLGLDKDGYPIVNINGKQLGCHVLAFQAFYPDLWAARKPGEKVLHEKDDKLDFRPQMLRLGTDSDNAKDAHDNGRFAGKKSDRMKCVSYINGIFEKEHESQLSAEKYLRENGYTQASSSNIRAVFAAYKNAKFWTAYGRTWKSI